MCCGSRFLRLAIKTFWSSDDCRQGVLSIHVGPENAIKDYRPFPEENGRKTLMNRVGCKLFLAKELKSSSGLMPPLFSLLNQGCSAGFEHRQTRF